MNENSEADDYPDRRHVAEKARFHVTLGVLRAALEEQPSPNAVISCGRRWIAAATQLVDEVVREKRDTKNQGGEQ